MLLDLLEPPGRCSGCWPPAQLRFSGFRFSGIRLGANDGARAIAANERCCGRRGASGARFNNCVEGAYGIARFAEREAVESDGHTRSTCGVRELRQPPVRRSVRQRAGRPPRGGRRRSFVGGDRAMLAAPRIGAGAGVRWRRRATAQQRAANTTLAATRRHR
jgi:hypothetical protein